MTISELSEAMIAETGKIIVGKVKQIRLIIMTLFAEGHMLLDDLPGVGKTTLVKTLAIVTGCDCKRIQFVPDLLPSDITGMSVYDQKAGDFKLRSGPVMTNILLADEINRAIPRTQSALLEAMEERQVTIDGVTMPLPEPFIVMATQNPVESETTFQLPAAQMDRFLTKISLGYPESSEELEMLKNLGDEIPFSSVGSLTDADGVKAAQRDIRGVSMSDAVARYIIDIVLKTRSDPLIKMGASPRATRGLYKASKAWAAMAGRRFVTPDDVQELAVPCLAHRLLLTGEARLARKNAEALIAEILQAVPVPPPKDGFFPT
ncbi:MAG: MoxR family ATPase [Oscillospiraceae bacterium]|nr:MoxR family ATPase [Oscillospiraceae bacterium]